MKSINKSNYNYGMGTLIDVRHPLDYKKDNVDLNSINIFADKLMFNPEKYLDKNKKYFIVCKRGTLSKKVVILLDRIGYDVTLLK